MSTMLLILPGILVLSLAKTSYFFVLMVRVGLRKRQANRTWGDIAQSAVGFVRRNSAIFRTHPQGRSKDAGAAPASFKPLCGGVRQIAEFSRPKPASSSAISPQVRFACLFLNPTLSTPGARSRERWVPYRSGLYGRKWKWGFQTP